MAATWAEWATDAPWSPWLFRQFRATFEGHTNGEAVAIEAVTINDPAKPAARWKNLGGGGAGSWQAADGSQIAAAPDTGFTFSKPVSGASASFSGAVSVGSLSAAGAVSAASVAASGQVSGATGVFSGQVNVGNLISAGAISGQGISGTTGSFSGAVTAAGATINGQLLAIGNQALKIQNSLSGGIMSLNATNVADPSLEVKDHSGDNIAVFNPSGSTYGLDVNNGLPSTNAARFTGDVLITTDLGVRTINATGMIYGGTPSARVYRTTTQTIADSTVTALTFDAERWDNASLHSTSSNTDRLVAPVAGIYAVTAHIRWDTNGTGQRLLRVKDNAGALIASASQPPVSGDVTYQSIATTVTLGASGYVTIEVYQTSGGNLGIGSAAQHSPEATMTKISQ